MGSAAQEKSTTADRFLRVDDEVYGILLRYKHKMEGESGKHLSMNEAVRKLLKIER